jgi:hypothetical protein
MGKNFARKAVEQIFHIVFSLCWHRTIALPFPRVKMGKGECAADLQEVLEMGTCIFMCFPTKLVGLHNVDQGWLELESFFSHIDCWSSPDVGSGWSGEFMESLVSHGFEH